MTGLLAVLVRMLESLPLLVFILIVPCISVPFALVTSAIAGVRRGHWMAQITKESWIRTALAGGVIRITLCALVSLLLTLAALPQLLLLSMTGWGEFAGTICLFLLLEHALKATFGRHFQPPFGHYASIRTAIVLTPLAALACSVLGLWLNLPLNPIREDYPQARSILVGQFISMGALIENTKIDWLEDGSPGNGKLLAAFIGTGFATLFASGWGALLSLPIAEWRRGVAPASVDPVAPRPTLSRVFTLVFVATLFFFFIWTKMVATAELRLKAMPEEERPVERTERFVREVEQIAGSYYEPGTIERVKDISAEEIPEAAEADLQSMRDNINHTADKMVSNVDQFLDDYYSLRAEYERLLALSVGKIEDSLVTNLTAALAQGGDYADRPDTSHLDALRAHPSPAVQKILDERRVALSEGETPKIVGSCPTIPCGLDDITREEMNRVKDRLSTAGGSTALGLVAGKVVGKLVGKGVIKVAAKALAKVAATKLASGGVGTMVGGLVGATLGSVVPGAGTAIGASGGAILGGLLTGVAVDALLMELEEYYGRDTFRAEIVGVINEWRDSTLTIVSTPRR